MPQTAASWQGQAAPEAIGSGALTQLAVLAEIRIPPVSVNVNEKVSQALMNF